MFELKDKLSTIKQIVDSKNIISNGEICLITTYLLPKEMQKILISYISGMIDMAQMIGEISKE